MKKTYKQILSMVTALSVVLSIFSTFAAAEAQPAALPIVAEFNQDNGYVPTMEADSIVIDGTGISVTDGVLKSTADTQSGRVYFEPVSSGKITAEFDFYPNEAGLRTDSFLRFYSSDDKTAAHVFSSDGGNGSLAVTDGSIVREKTNSNWSSRDSWKIKLWVDLDTKTWGLNRATFDMGLAPQDKPTYGSTETQVWAFPDGEAVTNINSLYFGLNVLGSGIDNLKIYVEDSKPLPYVQNFDSMSGSISSDFLYNGDLKADTTGLSVTDGVLTATADTQTGRVYFEPVTGGKITAEFDFYPNGKGLLADSFLRFYSSDEKVAARVYGDGYSGNLSVVDGSIVRRRTNASWSSRDSWHIELWVDLENQEWGLTRANSAISLAPQNSSDGTETTDTWSFPDGEAVSNISSLQFGLHALGSGIDNLKIYVEDSKPLPYEQNFDSMSGSLSSDFLYNGDLKADTTGLSVTDGKLTATVDAQTGRVYFEPVTSGKIAVEFDFYPNSKGLLADSFLRFYSSDEKVAARVYGDGGTGNLSVVDGSIVRRRTNAAWAKESWKIKLWADLDKGEWGLVRSGYDMELAPQDTAAYGSTATKVWSFPDGEAVTNISSLQFGLQALGSGIDNLKIYYTESNISINNGAKEIITIPENGQITVEYNFVPQEASTSASAQAILCEYEITDGIKKLIKCDFWPLTSANGETVNKKIQKTIDTSSTDLVRAFIWDNFNKLTPITNLKEAQESSGEAVLANAQSVLSNLSEDSVFSDTVASVLLLPIGNEYMAELESTHSAAALDLKESLDNAFLMAENEADYSSDEKYAAANELYNQIIDVTNSMLAG